jgi:WD40 repeat protein
MARRPEDRYATARDLAEDLRRYLDDRPVRARRAPAAIRLGQWCRRNKALAAAMASAALLLTALAAWASLTAAWQHEALRQLTEARREGEDKLWRTQLERARAARFSRRPGQRFNSLQALAEAARVARGLGLGEDDLRSLRNEAAACLALRDLRYQRTLLRMPASVFHRSGIDFDPDFRFFACSDLEGNLHLRRVADGQEVAVVPPPRGRVRTVAPGFSPDGRWLAATYWWHDGDGGLMVRAWEVRDGSLEPLAEPWPGCSFAFSSDNRTLAVAEPDGTIRLHDLATRKIRNLQAPGRLPRIAFRPDGAALAMWTKSGPRMVVLLDLEEGKEKARFDLPAFANSVAWRGDGKLLAAGCDNQCVYLLETGLPRSEKTSYYVSELDGHGSNGLRVLFSHAGDYLVSQSWDGTSRLWDAVTGRPLLTAPDTHVIALRRDDCQAALWRGTDLELWELAGGDDYRALHHGLVGNLAPRPTKRGVATVDFSGDGHRLAAADRIGNVRLWDLSRPGSDGVLLPRLRTPCVGFAEDGRGVVAVGELGLGLYPSEPADPAAAHPYLTRQECPLPTWFDLDPTRRWLGVAHSNGYQALVFRLGDPAAKATLEHPNVCRVEVSRDGRWAATATWQGKGVRVWDVRQPNQSVKEIPSESAMVAFCPRDRWLVTSTGEQVIRFWHVGSWEPGPVVPRSQATDVPSGLAFTPDGAMLAVTDTPGLRLLRADTGADLVTLSLPDDLVAGRPCFSPEGGKVAVPGGPDHIVHLWDLRAVRRRLADLGLDWADPPATD